MRNRDPISNFSKRSGYKNILEPETGRLCVNTHTPAIKKSHSGVTNSWRTNPKSSPNTLNSRLDF